jgi:hypothetical protein
MDEREPVSFDPIALRARLAERNEHFAPVPDDSAVR